MTTSAPVQEGEDVRDESVMDAVPECDVTVRQPESGQRPIGTSVLLIATMFIVERVETVLVLSHRFVPMLVQAVTSTKPVISGLFPDPYAPNVIGAPEVPEVLGVSDP